MTLSQEIKMFRAKHRLTQQGFADICGLTKMTISSIERGTQNPKEVTVLRIKYAMNSYEKGRKER